MNIHTILDEEHGRLLVSWSCECIVQGLAATNCRVSDRASSPQAARALGRVGGLPGCVGQHGALTL
jgi:hypothetical protein